MLWVDCCHQAAPRSNNELDASKLKAQFPEMLSIKEAFIEHVFKPFVAAGGKPIVNRSRYGPSSYLAN